MEQNESPDPLFIRRSARLTLATMRHYLGRRTESCAVVFLRELRVTDYRTQAGYIRVEPHKPMSDWIDIHYREYWDLPRMVIATGPGGTFLFWSRFDEELDEYIDHYEVWRMPPLSESDLSGSWVGLEGKALERMPDVPLRELPFIITSPNAQSHDPTVGV